MKKLDNDKVVYRHRRNDNDEIFYIGMGKPSRPFEKFNRKNNHWNNIVNKYDYSIEILASDLSKEYACELEMFLIQEYGLENLTNITSGGDGNNYWLGKKRDKETCIKLSKANKGKKLSIETIEKMKGRVAWNKGKKYPKEVIKKISDNNKMAKKVIDNNTGIIYNSCTKMCKKLNISYSTIVKKLNGTYKNNTNFKYL